MVTETLSNQIGKVSNEMIVRPIAATLDVPQHSLILDMLLFLGKFTFNDNSSIGHGVENT